MAAVFIGGLLIFAPTLGVLLAVLYLAFEFLYPVLRWLFWMLFACQFGLLVIIYLGSA
jgi:hypothetical protein